MSHLAFSNMLVCFKTFFDSNFQQVIKETTIEVAAIIQFQKVKVKAKDVESHRKERVKEKEKVMERITIKETIIIIKDQLL